MSNITGREPEIGAARRTGDEPRLTIRDLKGVGRRQRQYLRWLHEQGGEVSWLDSWKWMGERLGYLSGSKASQERMHEYIGPAHYSLVHSLEKRNLVAVLPEPDNPEYRFIRLLVDSAVFDDD